MEKKNPWTSLKFRDLHRFAFLKSGATRNRINLISGCISLNLYSAKDLISRYCSTDFLQCFASFSWVIFSSVHKGNRNHGRAIIFRKQFIWSSPSLFRTVTVAWLIKKILCQSVYLCPTLGLSLCSCIEVALDYS